MKTIILIGMSDGNETPRKIVPLMQRTDHCQGVVRRIAANADDIRFGVHAFDRSNEREISTIDAIDVLRTGTIKSGVVPGKSPGEWVCKIAKKIDPRKPEIGVVTVVINEMSLLVVTVEWEFPR